MVEALVVIGLALILANWLARRFNLVAPLVLIVVGALIAVIPGIPEIGVDSEIVLQVFLPILLYWEALNISFRGIKRSLRGVILNGTLMVLFVAVAIGLMGPVLGLTLGTALLIGASVGPTDATAVAALGKGINRGPMVVLRAESLINDGTALVVFALAVEYAGEHVEITASHAVLSFAISFGGGALIGLAVGWVTARLGMLIRRQAPDPLVGNLFRIFTPFFAFFAAESIEASGVLAVVVCGLYIAQVGPKYQVTASRVIARPFFGMISYFLNSLLFLLVGVHLVNAVRTLSSDTLWHAVTVTVVLYAVMMLARWVFGETIIRVIRLLDRRPSQRLRRTTFWERMVLTIAGFRGAISMAVALSIPETLSNGEGFPYRDLIIFVTGGIVVFSLVVQGALLPATVKIANRHPHPDRVVDPCENEREINAALIESAEIVLENLPRLAAENNVPNDAVERVRLQFATNRDTWVKASTDEFTREERESREGEQRLRLKTIEMARENMIRFRDQGKIDDESLIYLLERIDAEEIRLTGPIEME